MQLFDLLGAHVRGVERGQVEFRAIDEGRVFAAATLLCMPYAKALSSERANTRNWLASGM
jgi:hypothetical protein